MAGTQISPANTGGFSYLVSRDYTDIFYDEYMEWPALWSQIAKITTSDGNYEREAVLSPLGEMEELGEGGAINFDVPEQGYPKYWQHTIFGKGFQITEPMFDDDRTGKMKLMPKSLAQCGRWKQEVQFWDLFNSGFATHTCADTKYVFDQSRPLLNSGSTWSNEPSTPYALSESSFSAANQAFKDWVNESGMPIFMSPWKLIIPTDLEWLAKRLLRSEHRILTADNDINPAKGSDIGVDYMVNPYLTSSTAWFLVAKKHDARMVWRKKLAFKSGDDFNTGNALFKATQRFSNVVVDARGLYGSPGTT